VPLAALVTFASAISLAKADQVAYTLVGTIVGVRPAADSAPEYDLRLDRAETGGFPVEAGQVLAVQPESASPARRGEPKVGLGDQVRVQVSSLGDGRWQARGELQLLGRGEFLNPGQRPSRDLGSPQAKVLVKMFAPLHASCHLRTADLLVGIATEQPEQVRVQIFNLTNPAAREEMVRERLTCATVLVNNRYQFAVKGNGGERTVQLSHRPNEPESTYTSEDALAVVQQEMARLYPAPKVGAATAPTQNRPAPSQ